MNSRTYLLSLLILFVGVLACDVTSLAFTTLPTQTPDRIATRVAGTETAITEETAVTATLIAKAPRVIQTPLPIKTAEPTLTRLPPSPTATEARTITPTSTSTREGKLVQGGVYGIKVVSVEKADSAFRATGRLPMEYVYPESGYVFLKIGVELCKNGVLSLSRDDEKERLELSVLDSKGTVYSLANRETVTMGGDFCADLKTYCPTHYFIYISVPRNASGFKLKYRDLPLIDLEL